MQIKNSQIGWVILSSAVLLFLSFFREGFFLTINALSKGVVNNSHFYWLIKLAQSCSNFQLTIIKWGATLLFVLFFIAVTIFCNKKIFPTSEFYKILIVFYLLLLFVALIVGVYGVLFLTFDKVYFIVRFLFGFIQSPLMFFISTPVFIFILNQEE